MNNNSKKMKRTVFRTLISAILLSCVVFSCKEEPRGQTATNKTPPSPLSNVNITPLPGGAHVTYTLPNEEDIAYVKCEFVFNNKERTVLSSVYKNYLEVDGISEEVEIELKLSVVNNSEVASKPHLEKFIPLEPPMTYILKSMKVEPTFGGVKVSWENPSRILAGISFLASNDDGELEFHDILYSSLPQGTKSLRGFNTDSRTFAFSIVDKYENVSDTVRFEIEPIYEVMLDKELFARGELTGDISAESHDTRPIEHIWNGVLHGEHFEIWHTRADAGFIPPLTFTVDLGEETQLTRIVVYNRTGYEYGQHNLRFFDIWGIGGYPPPYTTVGTHTVRGRDPVYHNNEPVTVIRSDHEYYVDGSWQQDWYRLAECEIVKPSGSPVGVNTPEDIAAHMAGYEFEFPQDVPKTRFLRFVVFETWARTAVLHISEISVFGDDR